MNMRDDPLSTALACVRRMSDDGLRALVDAVKREHTQRTVDEMRQAVSRGTLLLWSQEREGRRHVARDVDRLEPHGLGSDLASASGRTLCGRWVGPRASAGMAGPRRPSPLGGRWHVAEFVVDCERCKAALEARRSRSA